ncbi:hypothetical protein CRYUN_Cryun05aG0020700 [Craigia yunnanensis]
MAKFPVMKLFLCFALMLLSKVEVAKSEYMNYDVCMKDCLKTSCQSPPGFWCNLKCEFYCVPPPIAAASSTNSLKNNAQDSKHPANDASSSSSQQTLGSDEKKESTKN